MASDWVVPALAAAVSLAFAALVARQWLQRRRPHQLAWGLGLAAYAAASALEALATTQGWTVAAYKAYFPLAAAPVGLLGLGTIYLLRPGRWGHAAAALVALGVLVTAAGAFVAPLDAASDYGSVEGAGAAGKRLAEWGPELGAKAIGFENPARWGFLLLNVVGGLALIGGALWSYAKTRSAGVLLIGLGAMLPAAGGALASFTGYDDRLMMQFLGVAVMFAGYLRSREAPPAPASAPAAAEASSQ